MRGISWRGDWEARIYERVRSRGFDTVTAFAEASPRATMLELAEELEAGAEDVNAAQIIALMRAEAERTNTVERFARNLLVHNLWEIVPKGWRVDPGNGFEFDFKAASALSSMTVSLPESAQDLGRRVTRIMMTAELPLGWLPDGPDDPILAGLFARAANDNPS
jgi:hypothetical protein